MRVQSNKKDFKGQNIFVGIDVHLKQWTVTVLTESGYKKKFSQPSCPKSLFDHLSKNYPGGIYKAVYESGFSGYSSCYELRKYGIDCQIVHAADVPTSQKEKVTKSDVVDSEKLARSLRNGELDEYFIYIPSSDSLDDRSLLRVRKIIQKESGRYRSQIKHLLYCNGISYPDRFQNQRTHWSRKFVEWLRNDVRLLSPTRTSLDWLLDEYLHLRQSLLAINRKLRGLSQTARYKKRYECLISIPGIGCITAMTLLVEIIDIKRFSSQKKFRAYLGLVPVMQKSDETVIVGEKTFRGNKHLGPQVIEASWIAIRHDAELAAAYTRHCHRGLKAQEAIIRIAADLAARIYAVLKQEKEYECR